MMAGYCSLERVQTKGTTLGRGPIHMDHEHTYIANDPVKNDYDDTSNNPFIYLVTTPKSKGTVTYILAVQANAPSMPP